MRKHGLFRHTDCIRFDVFGQIDGFNLAQNTFIKSPIRFRLTRQLLIANGRPVQCDNGALLFLDCRDQVRFGRLGLFYGVL